MFCLLHVQSCRCLFTILLFTHYLSHSHITIHIYYLNILISFYSSLISLLPHLCLRSSIESIHYVSLNCQLNYSPLLSFSSTSIILLALLTALLRLYSFCYSNIGSQSMSFVLFLLCTVISSMYYSPLTQIDIIEPAIDRSSCGDPAVAQMTPSLLIINIAFSYFAKLFHVFIYHFLSVSFLVPQ